MMLLNRLLLAAALTVVGVALTATVDLPELQAAKKKAKRAKRKRAKRTPKEIERELRKLDRELKNFLQLVAKGKAPEVVLAEIFNNPNFSYICR